MSNNGLNDSELIKLFQQQFQESPQYDAISNQFSSVSDDEDIVIPTAGSSISNASNEEKKIKRRWKYCCSKCTKSDKGSLKPKTCVCIVPASQRRILIGEQGCLTCHCTGCSIEDGKKKLKKKQKKRKQSSSSDSSSSSEESNDFKTVNGCCKDCMKAFSKKGKEGKACLCQVPKDVRRKPLPAHGCQFCGCLGCNPEDKKKKKKKNSKPLSPISEDVNDLNNFKQTPLIQHLTTENLNPAILGIGIPQRTFSYIYGREQTR